MDEERCILSSEALLTGLFTDIPNNNMTVVTVPEDKDILLGNVLPTCMQYQSDYIAVATGITHENLNTRADDLYQYLTDNSGKEISGIYSAYDLYDTLLSEYNDNKV